MRTQKQFREIDESATLADFLVSGIKRDHLPAVRVSVVIEVLRAEFPDTECSLVHEDAWQLLVATILSAQCTDARVNMVTPGLFEQFPTPADFAAAPIEEIEEAGGEALFIAADVRLGADCRQAVEKTLQRYGQIDVIIGTHRLLSGDVEFADLGLVVIDEGFPYTSPKENTRERAIFSRIHPATHGLGPR